MVDNYGKEILVGSLVVFNWSGYLAKGEVVGFTKPLSRYQQRIKVRIIKPNFSGYSPLKLVNDGHIALVKSSSNIMVL